MKKLCIVLVLLLWAGTLSAQTQPTQLQLAQQQIAEKNAVIKDVKAERNQLILRVDQLTKNAIAINDGIKKAENLLQKGYDFGKLNYEELRLMGFKISVDSTDFYQRPKPNKADPKK